MIDGAGLETDAGAQSALSELGSDDYTMTFIPNPRDVLRPVVRAP